jgi:hypothetical protein
LVCQRAAFKTKYHEREEVRQRSIASSADWCKANPERANAKTKKYQGKNSGAVKASRQRYVAANRQQVLAKNAARHCQRSNASVAWANRFFIAEAYRLAQKRTEMLGIRYVVDHVIPLNHPLVCGLHVEGNLQVISEVENLAKSNSFTPF